jgi:hypothetical protein
LVIALQCTGGGKLRTGPCNRQDDFKEATKQAAADESAHAGAANGTIPAFETRRKLLHAIASRKEEFWVASWHFDKRIFHAFSRRLL